MVEGQNEAIFNNVEIRGQAGLYSLSDSGKSFNQQQEGF